MVAIKPQQTILIVEDSALMQVFIKRVFEQDYQVITVSSAIDALATLNHEKIAVILLDVEMPGMDGLDLCRTIRAMPNFINLPIIMVTAKDTPIDKIKGKNAGATEYLTKPFNNLQLRQTVTKYIEVMRS
ncbi:MAG TPA: response regulator [Nostocaceae cyanobacterium]|nr:response regulator [Nostocaceae cyanobacterium]